MLHRNGDALVLKAPPFLSTFHCVVIQSTMKTVFQASICAAFLTAFLCGCATTSKNVSVTSGVKNIDRKAIMAAPVELPGGYDVDDFRRLRMAVSEGKLESNSKAFKNDDIMDFMNRRFQSEMDKHKRFKFIALHGNSTNVLDSLEDIGEMEADDNDESAKYQRPSLNLNWAINTQLQTVPKGSYEQNLCFYCTVNVTVSYYRDVLKKDKSGIKYHKGDVAFTQDFDLPVIEKKQVFSKTGSVKEGFSFASDADVQALAQEIIIAASQRIADDLGRRFPVGGRIVGALGSDMFTIDKGAEQGIEKGMEMVIFTRYDGVDIPLANATATPAMDRSQLEVWRFANDKYAKMILAEINGDPKGWMKETGNGLFGVRAVPAQDASAGTRFE
jgi:hypothetical protein